MATKTHVLDPTYAAQLAQAGRLLATRSGAQLSYLLANGYTVDELDALDAEHRAARERDRRENAHRHERANRARNG